LYESDDLENLIFTCLATTSSYLTFQVPLFAASLRTYGGDLSECPLWVFIPHDGDSVPNEVMERLKALQVTIFSLDCASHEREFPFATHVRAAASAESKAREYGALLAWMGIDTLILNPPTAFLLEKHISVGYRPVHHTLIGSLLENPPDPFWSLIYEKLRVPQDAVFPMHPHVDHNIIRPYVNAGHLVVRPERRIFQTWWESFKLVYDDPSFEPLYEQNILYEIFIHQAVITGVILSQLRKEELLELPFTYNYPLHLYHEAPEDLRPEHVNDLVTVRYEKLDVLKKFPFQESVKKWLKDTVQALD
jgi:hypothetical protein